MAPDELWRQLYTQAERGREDTHSSVTRLTTACRKALLNREFETQLFAIFFYSVQRVIDKERWVTAWYIFRSLSGIFFILLIIL